MAQFSSSDINDAKMRVQEMRRRAKNYVDDNDESVENNASKIQPMPQNNTNSTADSSEKISPAAQKEDDSFALILALILVLSSENADRMLILALLYILL